MLSLDLAEEFRCLIQVTLGYRIVLLIFPNVRVRGCSLPRDLRVTVKLEYHRWIILPFICRECFERQLNQLLRLLIGKLISHNLISSFIWILARKIRIKWLNQLPTQLASLLLAPFFPDPIVFSIILIFPIIKKILMNTMVTLKMLGDHYHCRLTYHNY